MDIMSTFVGLSSALTGFAQDILAPRLDTTNIKTLYLQSWTENIAQETGDAGLVNTILQQYAELQAAGKSDEEIGEQLMNGNNSPAFVLACQKLIFLWYMGAWPDVNAQPGTETGGFTTSSLLSAESYTSGLVWQVMQAHPMGDSNYRYGYWAEQPPALSDFTGN